MLIYAACLDANSGQGFTSLQRSSAPPINPGRELRPDISLRAGLPCKDEPVRDAVQHTIKDNANVAIRVAAFAKDIRARYEKLTTVKHYVGGAANALYKGAVRR